MSNSSTSSSKPRPWWQKLLLGLGFPLGFVVLLAFLNASVRPVQSAQDIWYGPLIQAVGQGYHPNFLFIGTSRTRAAIDPASWEQVMIERFGVRTSAVNLGMGWSTPMEHYHGLRAVLKANPAALRGSAVLIEAGEGIGFPERWDDNWIVQDRRDLLVPYLEPSDFLRIWKSSTPAEAKFAIASDLWFPAFDQMARLRHEVRSDLDTLGMRIQGRIWAVAKSQETADADLSTDGGIRADKKGVEWAMFLAESLARADLRDQKPLGNWDSTVVAGIVELVKGAGGLPVFVRIPYSPTQAAVLATGVRQADKLVFQNTLRRWEVPRVIEASFQPKPEDFPDKWHLRRTLAPEFTRSLAQAYLSAFVR